MSRDAAPRQAKNLALRPRATLILIHSHLNFQGFNLLAACRIIIFLGQATDPPMPRQPQPQLPTP
jgi:hypothetical protein